ncbi:hypothetical protein, partial [Nodularia spumigena]|uniref:hypothetical protein n=1 Tax=Nodularia spumigena TaxID=70799 RepID=UPI002B207D04
HSFARENNLTLSEFELIRSKCLGLDSSKKVFIYADFDKNPALKHVIKLQDIQSVSVKESSRKVETSKSESHILDKLDLNFKAKSGKTNDIAICLYSTDEAFNMLGELHLANKWVSILNARFLLF